VDDGLRRVSYALVVPGCSVANGDDGSVVRQ
jgi:hypothetical protein